MTTQRRLDADGIREMLRGEPFVRQLIVEERVGSTNDRIRELAATGAEEGTVVIAESQSRGRGRLGRSWLSRPGLGLYLSVLFRPRAPIPELTRWTLAAAVAACAACRQVGGCKVEIDWPNDLVHDGRKLGGLLAEMKSGGSRAAELVVGTGLNVLHDEGDFTEELAGKATSLRLAGGGSDLRRELLAAVYLGELAGVAEELNSGRWNAIARRWEEMAPGAHGLRVRVAEFEGVTAGLDPTGALLVRGEDGSELPVRMAESVVPLQGRVPCC